MNEYLSFGNKEWLLQNIDQEKVWSSILGYTLKPGQQILNPLRIDKHIGSCTIQTSSRNNNLILFDFADSKTNGYDCVSAYRYLHPYKSWAEICSELMSIGPTIPTSAYKVLPGLKPKVESEFIPIYREWLDSDLEWWYKRGIVKSQLDRETTLVKPIKGYVHKKDKKESQIHFNELCYCYHHLEKVKFYFPNRKEWRFLGNMSKNDLWFIHGCTNNLIVTKSHKDCLALESCFPDFSTTHVQAETNFPDNHILLDWEMYDNVYLIYDNDEQGHKGAELLSKQFLYKKPKQIFLEYHKDVSAFIFNEGLNETIDYLNTLL